MPAHGDLLGGRLGVEVDEDDARLLPDGLNFRLEDAERIVNGRHEDTSHGVDDRDRHTATRPRDVHAAARRARRHVHRPEEPRLFVKVRQDFLLVPDVVAAGHHVHAVLEEVVGDVRRDAEPGRRVLDVGDHQIDLLMRDQRGEASAHQLPSRLADDVADEQEANHPGDTGTMMTWPRRSAMRGTMTRN
jgi:hypothetical protein